MRLHVSTRHILRYALACLVIAGSVLSASVAPVHAEGLSMKRAPVAAEAPCPAHAGMLQQEEAGIGNVAETELACAALCALAAPYHFIGETVAVSVLKDAAKVPVFAEGAALPGVPFLRCIATTGPPPPLRWRVGPAITLMTGRFLI